MEVIGAIRAELSKQGKKLIRRNKEEHASGGEANGRAVNGGASHVIYVKEELSESKGKTDQRSKRSIEEESFETTRSKEWRVVTLCNRVQQLTDGFVIVVVVIRRTLGGKWYLEESARFH